MQRLGKEQLFVLQIADDELHENDAAYAIARAPEVRCLPVSCLSLWESLIGSHGNCCYGYADCKVMKHSGDKTLR